NAIKFTEEGEIKVSTSASQVDENRFQYQFIVSDTGIGIPQNRLNRLFKSFSQVDASTTRKFGGTGLGLAISKTLAELMGGEMWVSSQEGAGSKFYFTIECPLSTEPITGQSFKFKESKNALLNKHFLIVDDNETNRIILEKQLAGFGGTSQSVSSGAEALAVISDGGQFDLAILDMHMPEMDGATLAEQIKTKFPQANFPLVMLSSMGQSLTPKYRSYFQAKLHKPVKLSQFITTLLRVFNQSAVNDKHQSAASEKELDESFASTYPLRILLVEDNVVNQKVALRMLQKLGYTADVASNGVEAVQSLRRQPYDLLLMDEQMPEMDGVEATKIIIEEWREERPLIIAMTANAMQGDKERFLSVGMDGYVSKPVKISVLAEEIERSIHAKTSTN
ncbi:MAG: response regulator, partial [Chloroflexota bacterium]